MDEQLFWETRGKKGNFLPSQFHARCESTGSRKQISSFIFEVQYIISGQGLGKDEEGIKEAIKVKVKQDKAGVSIF